MNLLEAIVEFLIREFGMKREDTGYVKIYCLLYLVGAGLGRHPDIDNKHGFGLFMMRMVVSIGASREIVFKAYKFTEANENAHGLRRAKDVEPFSIKTEDVGDAYLMTQFGCGKKTLCWEDDDKKVGILLQHEALRAETMEDQSMNMVIDFPLRTFELVHEALEKMKSRQFDLKLWD